MAMNISDKFKSVFGLKKDKSEGIESLDRTPADLAMLNSVRRVKTEKHEASLKKELNKSGELNRPKPPSHIKVDALLDLLSNPESPFGDDFDQNLLLNLARFTTPSRLLHLMFEKYLKADITSKRRIIGVLGKWLELSLEDFVSDDTRTLVMLANWWSVLNSSTDKEELTFTKLIRALYNLPAEKAKDYNPTVNRNLIPSEQKKAEKTKGVDLFDKTNPIYLACQIAARNFADFSNLNLNFVGLCDFETNDNQGRLLERIRDDFHKTSFWIAGQVLEAKSDKARKENLTKAIKLAETLLFLKNLHAVFVIYRALTMPAVSSLYKVWRSLSSDVKAIWKRIESIVSPVSAVAYENTIKTLESACLIPSHHLTTQILEEIEMSSPDSNEQGEINYEKIKSLAAVIFPLKKFQRIPYNVDTDPAIQFLLEKDLATSHYCKLSQTSQKLEPQDDSWQKLDLELQPWFFGSATKTEVEKILLSWPENGFCVTNGPNSGLYLIYKINKQNNDQITNSAIIKENNSYTIKGTKFSYATLPMLIEFSNEVFGFTPLHPCSEVTRQLKEKYKLPLPDDTDFSNMYAPSLFYVKPRSYGRTSQFWSVNKTYGTTASQDIVTEINQAAELGKPQRIFELVMSGDFRLDDSLSEGKNLYHIAAEQNCPGLVDSIAQSPFPKPDIDARDNYGWTPLHSASKEGFFLPILSLLKYGANPNLISNGGAVPLHYLVRVKDPEDKNLYRQVLQLMVTKGASLNIQDVNLNTPLHLAVMQNNLIATKILIESGANYSLVNKEGKSPFSIAFQSGNKELFGLLPKMNLEPVDPTHNVLAVNMVVHTIKFFPENSVPSVVAPEFMNKLFIDRPRIDIYSHKYASKPHSCIFGEFKNKTPVIIIAQYDKEVADWEEKQQKLKEKLDKGEAVEPEKTENVSSENLLHSSSTAHNLPHGKGTLLVRTPVKDYEIALSNVVDRKALNYSLKIFGDFGEVKAMDDSVCKHILLQAERDICADTQIVSSIVYVAEGNYSRDSMFKKAKVSPAFEEFLTILGTKTLYQQGGNADQYVLCSKSSVNSSDVLFYVNSGLPEGDQGRKTIMTSSVVVVFLESTIIDTTIFSSDTKIIIVVKPFQVESNKYYRVSVWSRKSVPKFGPFDFPSIFMRDNLFREFLLCKVINGDYVVPTQWIVEDLKKKRTNIFAAISDAAFKSFMSKKLSSGTKQKSNEAETLETYKMGDPLGKGATARAFLCTHKVTKKNYCMKVIDKSGIKDEYVLKSIDNEMLLLQKMNHKNIIKAYNKFNTEKEIYFVLELCTGGSLQDEITKNGVYTELQAAEAFYQILDAMKYLHSHNMCHRDMKPENILFLDSSKRELKILDFGFAKEHENEQLGQTIAGTPDYIAPEVIGGDKYDYKQIDMWSVGGILYFMLFGRPPFKKFTNLRALINGIISGAYDFEDPNIRISPECQSFIRKMLCTDPASRITAAKAIEDPWIQKMFKGELSSDVAVAPPTATSSLTESKMK